MRVIIVAGAPGAGKTTVLNGVLEELAGVFEIINYGDEMLEVAKRNGVVESRDEIRKQPPEVQKKIQRAAAESIAKKAKKTSVIVDTHCLIKTSKGYLAGLPIWVLEKLNPSMIVLIEADPEEISGRRISDITRARDKEYIAEIEEHQQMNRAIAAAYAMITGATVKIVKNNNNKLEKAIEEMRNALR